MTNLFARYSHPDDRIEEHPICGLCRREDNARRNGLRRQIEDRLLNLLSKLPQSILHHITRGCYRLLYGWPGRYLFSYIRADFNYFLIRLDVIAYRNQLVFNCGVDVVRLVGFLEGYDDYYYLYHDPHTDYTSYPENHLIASSAVGRMDPIKPFISKSTYRFLVKDFGYRWDGFISKEAIVQRKKASAAATRRLKRLRGRRIHVPCPFHHRGVDNYRD